MIKRRGDRGKTDAVGYVLDARANLSYKAVNLLVNAGIDVYRISGEFENPAFSTGSFYVGATAQVKLVIDKIVAENQVQFIAVTQKPAALSRIAKARIALWDIYGGSMASGWVRWLLEQYNYSFDVVYAKEIDNGNLKAKYDVLVFVGGAIPAVEDRNQSRREVNEEKIPDEYKKTTGRITGEKSIPELRLFLEQGGHIVTIGSSTQLAYHLKLPVSDALVEIVNGEEKPLPRDKYYTPGSILRMQVNNGQLATAGLNPETDIYFDNSPVFNLNADAVSKGFIRPLAWFGNDKILRSGWSLGDAYLKNGVTAFEAKLGKGKLYAFGPEITFRAQSQGTFKLLFNQLYNE